MVRNRFVKCFFTIWIQAFFIAVLQYGLIKQCLIYDSQGKENSKNSDLVKKDMIQFPVPSRYLDAIYFEDTYGDWRSNGSHVGIDIMDKQNRPGIIPIVSATDGEITNIGWLYLGGYRIGITSFNQVYYYYAHLDSYAQGICVGTKVKAGQLIGFMGNTGEGEEGTKGKFDVHLHFGIYFFDPESGEQTINPYQFLRNLSEK